MYTVLGFSPTIHCASVPGHHRPHCRLPCRPAHCRLPCQAQTPSPVSHPLCQVGWVGLLVVVETSVDVGPLVLSRALLLMVMLLILLMLLIVDAADSLRPPNPPKVGVWQVCARASLSLCCSPGPYMAECQLHVGYSIHAPHAPSRGKASDVTSLGTAEA